MQRSTALFVLLIIGCLNAYGQNSPLYTFSELMETLRKGYSVKGTFYFDKCEKFVGGNKVDSSSEIVVGMFLGVFEYYGRNASANNKAYVIFSETTLKEVEGGHFVQNQVSVRLSEDGRVEVVSKDIDPVSFTVKKEERYQTTLFNGTNKASGAYFYVSD